MMLARSVSEAFATTSAAVGPSWPIRMSSGPPSRNEKPRSAWSSCIEETPTSITTPSTAAMPCAAQTSARLEKRSSTRVSRPSDCVDQIEAAGNRRPVAVDADDPGSRRCRGSRGCSRRRRRSRRHRCRRRGARASRPPRGRERRYGAAQPGSCAVPWRIPACELETGRQRAHCASNLCASPGFSGQKAAAAGAIAASPPGLATPHFRTEFAGLPWHFERERGPRPSPKPVRLFTT